MRSEARRPYVTAIFQHGSWSGRAHSRHQDALPLRIPTMISGMCSLVIPRTRFRALAAQEAKDGNATPADRNVQPSMLTSFQQLRGRVVQHWHSAEKYANNRYTSAQNSTRQSTSPISDISSSATVNLFQPFSPVRINSQRNSKSHRSSNRITRRPFSRYNGRDNFHVFIDMCVPTWGLCSKFERGGQDCRDCVQTEPPQIRLCDLAGSIHRKHIPEVEVPNVAAPV